MRCENNKGCSERLTWARGPVSDKKHVLLTPAGVRAKVKQQGGVPPSPLGAPELHSDYCFLQRTSPAINEEGLPRCGIVT
jgi:hypothetical protein